MRPRSSAATWMTDLPATDTGTRGNLSGVPGLGSSVGVTIAEPPRVVPEYGRAMFFVVEPDRECWSALNAGSVMAACGHLRSA